MRERERGPRKTAARCVRVDRARGGHPGPATSSKRPISESFRSLYPRHPAASTFRIFVSTISESSLRYLSRLCDIRVVSAVSESSLRYPSRLSDIRVVSAVSESSQWYPSRLCGIRVVSADSKSWLSEFESDDLYCSHISQVNLIRVIFIRVFPVPVNIRRLSPSRCRPLISSHRHGLCTVRVISSHLKPLSPTPSESLSPTPSESGPSPPFSSHL